MTVRRCTILTMDRQNIEQIGMCRASLAIHSTCMSYLWGVGRDGMGWDRTGWDGWDGTGWDGMFVHVHVADQSNQPEHSSVYNA